MPSAPTIAVRPTSPKGVVRADDEPVVRVLASTRLWTILEDVLSPYGLHLERSESVPALIAAEATAGPNVALIDWAMTSGYLMDERRSELGKLCRNAAVVVLVPSRWKYVLRADELGVADLISKPIDLDELTDALAKNLPTLRENFAPGS
jgi:DNA-binding NarL/FixJ family response regulator